jgi:hypothetical protein
MFLIGRVDAAGVVGGARMSRNSETAIWLLVGDLLQGTEDDQALSVAETAAAPGKSPTISVR